MMGISDEKGGLIADLFRHNTWANLKLLDACERLEEKHLDASVPGTFGSIRDTLSHMVRAEVSYVSRVNGRSPGKPREPGIFPGIDALKRAAEWSGEELLQLALNARPTDIVRDNHHGGNTKYRLVGLMTQVINHATEHRVQIATILTQQGIEPPDMSGWMYMSETGQLEEAEEASPSD